MFLFANDSVLDFYPRFGFKNYEETGFVKSVEKSKPNGKLKKLNIGNDKNLQIALKSINHRSCITKIFGADDYPWITMWHIINLYKESLYYHEDKELLAIHHSSKRCDA